MTTDSGAAEEVKMSEPGFVQPEMEQKKTMSYEELAKMPLESLLYYVLVGDGRRNW
jgi:hypothetical protein